MNKNANAIRAYRVPSVPVLLPIGISITPQKTVKYLFFRVCEHYIIVLKLPKVNKKLTRCKSGQGYRTFGPCIAGLYPPQADYPVQIL
jgi:hypothetical protein